MSGSASIARLAAAGVLLLVGFGSCAQGAPVPPARLGLLDAVRATLSLNPDVALAEQRLRASRGALETAQGRFDGVLQARVGQRRETLPGSVDPGPLSTFEYELGATRELRSGLTLTPRAALSRGAGSGDVEPAAQATLSLSLTQPLLRGRGRTAAAAQESAAVEDAQAAGLRFSHARAEQVLGTVLAYWSCRAAHETVEIQLGAERRAAVFLDEERRMVEERERAPADLFQVRANLADARANLADAERGYAQARRQLGSAMGIPWREIERLGPPADSFELLDAAAPAAPDVEALVRLALEGRADLRAVRAERSSAGILVAAARRALEPQLDFTAQVGYAGAASGRGTATFFDPFTRRLAGPNVFAGLTFQFPTRNRAARGALAQQQAREGAAAIGADELARQIGSDVALAASLLVIARRELQNALEARDAFRVAKDNELAKLRSALSTTFDVLQIDTRLTAAHLSVVRAQSRVAEAVARLRFETGTLLAPGDDGGAPTLQALTSPPTS